MPNVLNREFSVTEPSKVWVRYHLYSCQRRILVFNNCSWPYDRKIIGWSLSSGMSVEETSWLGEWLLKPQHHKGIVISFWWGVQYAVKKFTNVVDSYKIITRSMSRKGNCWDNAQLRALHLKQNKLWKQTYISQKRHGPILNLPEPTVQPPRIFSHQRSNFLKCCFNQYCGFNLHIQSPEFIESIRNNGKEIAEYYTRYKYNSGLRVAFRTATWIHGATFA
jgi:transposase InsO family protein